MHVIQAKLESRSKEKDGPLGPLSYVEVGFHAAHLATKECFKHKDLSIREMNIEIVFTFTYAEEQKGDMEKILNWVIRSGMIDAQQGGYGRWEGKRRGHRIAEVI